MTHTDKMRAAYLRLDEISTQRHALNMEEQSIRDSICDALGVLVDEPARDSRTGEEVLVVKRKGDFMDHMSEDGTACAVVSISGRPKTRLGFHSRNWGYCHVADPAGWFKVTP